ncbi:MAG: 3'-5' exonuclease [Cytophagales bacterium]|nr:MAG: 3'-5' exonuclease [Cytophagales bacterium]
MKYIILDLEATCWEGKSLTKRPNEIIEIGAICVDEQKQILGEFVTFVKPLKNPILSDFCTQLTSINQTMVDTAPYFPEALAHFQQWIQSFDIEYWLCSWGFYDRTQFKQDCLLHQLPTEWLQNHISLKHQYTTIAQLHRHIGMKGALQNENIPLEGTHHRGIDDARNINKIFLKYFHQWQFTTVV